MQTACLKERSDGLILKIRVNPRASRTEPEGILDGRLKLRVQAPPVEGKANEAVLKWARKAFNIRSSQVDILRGEKSREKDLFLRGLSIEAAGAVLAPWLQ